MAPEGFAWLHALRLGEALGAVPDAATYTAHALAAHVSAIVPGAAHAQTVTDARPAASSRARR